MQIWYKHSKIRAVNQTMKTGLYVSLIIGPKRNWKLTAMIMAVIFLRKKGLCYFIMWKIGLCITNRLGLLVTQKLQPETLRHIQYYGIN